MNRKFTLLLMAPLLLGFNAAWADNHEDDDAVGLPDAAADAARENAQIPEAAAEGLAIAAEKTAGLPSEVTIRLMDDADSEDSEAVTADVQLPTLPEEGAEIVLTLAPGRPLGVKIVEIDYGMPSGAPARPDSSMPKIYTWSDSTVIFRTLVLD